MYKISVICPVFNSEKYLNKAIDSVINQTFGFENIELILIDDKSTDDSKIILKEYADKYDNIKVYFLNENHKIPGFARNVGLRNATADYLMFLDSDDEYDTDICKQFYTTIINEKCDMVICNIVNYDDTGYKRIRSAFDNFSSNIITTTYPDTIYYNDGYMCNKLFKREILIEKKIEFITDGFYEDALFCKEYFINSKKICTLNYNGYYYYSHENNISTPSLESNNNILQVQYKLIELYEKYGLEVNYSKIVYETMQGTLERLIFMDENGFKNMKNSLIRLYEFEKKINFDNSYIKNPIFKYINALLLKNHITIVTIIICISSIFSKNKLLKQIYRKFFQ